MIRHRFRSAKAVAALGGLVGLVGVVGMLIGMLLGLLPGALAAALPQPATPVAAAARAAVAAQVPVAQPPATDPVATPAAVLLTPESGPVGTTVKAQTQGSCSGDLSFVWAETGQPWGETASTDGWLTATTTVPQEFSPGSHEVRVLCTGDHPFDWAPATFVVPGPTMSVNPLEGDVGTVVSATLPGSCPGDVTVSWDDDPALSWGTVESREGGYVATTTVPRGLSSGSHRVTALCTVYGRVLFSWESEGYTVTVATPPSDTTSTPVPDVVMRPDDPTAGRDVTAEASGFVCGQVVFLWDDDLERAGASPVAADGTASATLRVPSAFTDRHSLVVRCEPATDQVARTTFTVAPDGSQVTTTTDVGTSDTGDQEQGGILTLWVWVAVALVAVLLLAAVLTAVALRGPRSRRWVRGHVRVVPGRRAAEGFTIVDTPVDPRRPEVSVRLEPHPHPGEHVIEEMGT